MNKKYLIGLHGKPRVGKDTVAAHLIKKLNLVRYGGSTRMKDTVSVMFDVPREYLDDDYKKDQNDPFWNMTYRQMCQKVGKESSRDVFGEDFWLRHVEKKWKAISEAPMKCSYCSHGSETHTIVAPCDWYGCTACNCTEWRPIPGTPYDGMILADIRYANEVEWVKRQGGDVFFIVRNDAPETSDQGHIVDAGLPLALADQVIYNHGTIEELYARIDNMLPFYYSWPE